MKKYDYSFARPLGSVGDWEKVLSSDCPYDWSTGLPDGPDDCFKLEFSGWSFYIEFKPINN